MNRTNFAEKLNTKEWAKTLNHLQNVAKKSLTGKEYLDFLKRQAQDMEKCDGCDYLLINGQAFDWREFNYKGKEIVLAFLRYFTDEQLETMERKL